MSAAAVALAADDATAGLEDMNRRTVVVALYNQALLWWIAREPKPRPTARELAIITLLAGEFPEHANRLRKELSGAPTRWTCASIPMQVRSHAAISRYEHTKRGWARHTAAGTTIR
jgi:hypothetical protein